MIRVFAITCIATLALLNAPLLVAIIAGLLLIRYWR